MPNPKNDQAGWYRAFAEITTLGLTFPLSIGAGYLLGWWLDGLFGTGPWLKVVLTGLGVVAAFLQLIRLAARHDREDTPSGGAGDERGGDPPGGW